MKHEGKMEKLQNKMTEKGERLIFLLSLIVYGRDKYYGIFSGVKYARLTTKRRNREIAGKLEKMLVEKLSKKENNRVHKETKRRVVSLTLLPNLRDYFAHQKGRCCFFLLFAPKCPISDKSPPSSCYFPIKKTLIFFQILLGLS